MNEPLTKEKFNSDYVADKGKKVYFGDTFMVADVHSAVQLLKAWVNENTESGVPISPDTTMQPSDILEAIDDCFPIFKEAKK